MPSVAFVSPFSGAEFAMMVASFEVTAVIEKVRLARSLIGQGCRYAVCAGVDCADWETVFDDVDVEKNPEGEASRFVMTTSHEGESLEEVVEFFLQNTFIQDSRPERFLVLTVGGQTEDRKGNEGGGGPCLGRCRTRALNPTKADPAPVDATLLPRTLRVRGRDSIGGQLAAAFAG